MARAFLHRGEIGKIYNIGGTHEKTNLEVAQDFIRLRATIEAEEVEKKEEGRRESGSRTLLIERLTVGEFLTEAQRTKGE